MDPSANPIANASTGKPSRFRRWIAVVVGLLVVLLCLPVLHTAVWIGSRERTLVFSIVDSESHLPVARALITVFHGASDVGVAMPAPAPDPSDSGTQSFATSDDGKAKATCEFEAHGRDNWISDWGRISFWNRYVLVSAAGYDPAQFNLADRIGDERDIHDDSAIELLVELKPARESRAEGVE